jgi:Arc/MetJ-type ribon-helix-helix transcriptional regulator
MTIQLTPEDEQLIAERLRTGAFHDAAEVLHDALASQDFAARWLARNKQPLNGKIARRIAQLDCGESVTPGDARARLIGARSTGPGPVETVMRANLVMPPRGPNNA